MELSNHTEAKRLMAEAKAHLNDANLCLIEKNKCEAVIHHFGSKLSPMSLKDWYSKIEKWTKKHKGNLEEAELKSRMAAHFLTA